MLSISRCFVVAKISAQLDQSTANRKPGSNLRKYLVFSHRSLSYGLCTINTVEIQWKKVMLSASNIKSGSNFILKGRR
jgi:hypothetical protein